MVGPTNVESMDPISLNENIQMVEVFQASSQMRDNFL